MCDYRRVLDWWMDLLITYTSLGNTSNYSATANLHNSQINAVPDKFFQPAVSSPAFPWQRLLTVCLHNLQSRTLSLLTELSSQTRLAYNLSVRTT
jgi:hypothetical protein